MSYRDCPRCALHRIPSAIAFCKSCDEGDRMVIHARINRLMALDDAANAVITFARASGPYSLREQDIIGRCAAAVRALKAGGT
jgi:hypothetical protein